VGSTIMSASEVAPVVRVLVLLSLSIPSQCQRQLVVGGWIGSRLSSVEIFPLLNDTCSIPDLPSPRSHHTLSLLPGGKLVVCGGEPLSKSCIAWSGGSTSWTHLYTTSVARIDHVAWPPPSLPDSIVLLGGYDGGGRDDAAQFTAEIVPDKGFFALRHSGYRACGIPDEDTIVMIGGRSNDHVTRYNVNGFVEELPQLPRDRMQHACAALPSTKAFIVAGGIDFSQQLIRTVLTLLPGATSWTPLASLPSLGKPWQPRSLSGVRASIVEGKMWLTGGSTGGYDPVPTSSEVLEYQPEPSNQWTTVGQLETGKSYHAVLSIDSGALTCLEGASGTTTSPDPMLFFLIGLFFLCRNQCGLCTNIVKEKSNPKYGMDFDAEARDTNPEYESVDANQGTRARSDNHSNTTQVSAKCQF